jgi:hypothetical protein
MIRTLRASWCCRPRSERGSVTVVAAAVMVVMAILALACADVARTLTAGGAPPNPGDKTPPPP